MHPFSCVSFLGRRRNLCGRERNQPCITYACSACGTIVLITNRRRRMCRIISIAPKSNCISGAVRRRRRKTQFPRMQAEIEERDQQRDGGAQADIETSRQRSILRATGGGQFSTSKVRFRFRLLGECAVAVSGVT